MQVSPKKRPISLGFVAPAYHPAPFDTRVIAGALPQYNKVVYDPPSSYMDTLEQNFKKEQIDRMATSLTESTKRPNTGDIKPRRRWHQPVDPKMASSPNLPLLQIEPIRHGNPFDPLMIKRRLNSSSIDVGTRINRLRAFIEVN